LSTLTLAARRPQDLLATVKSLELQRTVAAEPVLSALKHFPAVPARYADFPEELDPRLAASRRRAPWLIVHGDRDETVPLAEGEELAAAAAPPCELLRIEGADHTFGAKTPFAGPNPLLIAAMNATQTWLLRWLR